PRCRRSLAGTAARTRSRRRWARARRRGSARRGSRRGYGSRRAALARAHEALERAVAPVGSEHERPERARERIIGAVLPRDRAYERDVAREAVALRARVQLEVGRRRAQVVDTQVDGRDGGQLLHRARDGEPGGVVDERRDRAPEDDAPARVTD